MKTVYSRARQMKKIAELRRQAGINLRVAAAGIEISYSYLSHLERRPTDISLPVLCRLCDFYGISIAAFVKCCMRPKLEVPSGLQKAALFSAQVSNLAVLDEAKDKMERSAKR